MNTAAHVPGPASAEPLLWPLARVLARSRPAARSRCRQPAPRADVPDTQLPLRCGESYRWPDGTWTLSG